MSELVTLIVATGARTEAFKHCERMMMRQTYKGPVQMIVVDDCPQAPTTCGIPATSNIKQLYLQQTKLPWRTDIKINTQRYNLAEAIPHIKGDYILVPEDDDWYRNDYIESYVYLLQKYAAVGEGNSLYYNIKSRSWKTWENYKHCSLCQSGFRKELLPRFVEAVHSGDLFIDMALWNIFNFPPHNIKPFLFANQYYCVGMKGMPGRHGIGGGHFPDGSFKPDPGFEKLKEMVGADVEFYKEMAKLV